MASALRRQSATHGQLRWTGMGAGEAGPVLLAAVNGTRGEGPGQRCGQCVARARETGIQEGVLGARGPCAGWSNGCCCGTLTAPLAWALATSDSEGHSIRRAGLGLRWSGTGPGSVQLGERCWSTQNHG